MMHIKQDSVFVVRGNTGKKLIIDIQVRYFTLWKNQFLIFVVSPILDDKA